MCGISGIVGHYWFLGQLDAMIACMKHRGPDDTGRYLSPDGMAALGQNRLAIIDLSSAGHQPMASADGLVHLTFNGEIYNYVELRAELVDYPYRSRSDTEVVLAAYQKWGSACLDKFVGMFTILIWDESKRELFAARDRFGVKPLYYHQAVDGTLFLASEIKALHAAGVPKTPNPAAWAAYLAFGATDHSNETFWQGIYVLPAGHTLHWQDNRVTIASWYDLANHAVGTDERTLDVIQDEYLALLEDTVRLRFRSDVPVGITLSGGLDSSALIGLVRRIQGEDSTVRAYTFTTGATDYDELPWVQQMLARTQHSLVECRLDARDVPVLAESVQAFEDEPFGGVPTLAYARLFERARADGTIVLLDGQGVDEQWAGYDYYARALSGNRFAPVVQGATDRPVRPECLMSDFAASARMPQYVTPFGDALRDMQYRDIRYTKIPRALRFNDRASMRASAELREPFLDHRLFELALCQPASHKIQGGVHKWMMRRITRDILPQTVSEAPKRAVQTPQREWLRGELCSWATEHIENAIALYGDIWLDASAVRNAWSRYRQGESDNSFYVWQWISLSLMGQQN